MTQRSSDSVPARSRRPRILLIQAVDYDRKIHSGLEPQCAPASIATVAALTPEDFDVDLWDENLDGPIDNETTLPSDHYDIVGISTLFERVGRRVPIIANIFRARGSYICAGGPGISNQLSRINDCVDTTFLNEAEYTWPDFLKAWLLGTPQSSYVQVAKPDLSHSPAPKWGAIGARIREYRAGSVQTTRGCPFDCEFCDVIYLYGRAQRHKPIDNVLTEIRNLEQLGARRIFFTDDEFVGDPTYAKALLGKLVPLNNSFAAPIAYHTQFTLTLSRREELLELIADANFWYGVVGIESFDEKSLRETNKVQNCQGDIIEGCQKILSYGIGINGSLIVGFDNDGPDVFERILTGVQTACIPVASASILRATYGTKLWTRMRENKRLWKLPNQEEIPEALQVDILPAGELSRVDLIEGRIYLNNSLARVDNLCTRLRGWVDLVKRNPNVVDPRQLSLDDAIGTLRSYEALAFTTGERRLIEDTLAYTHEKRPIMMGRMVDSIVNQVRWHRLRTLHNTDVLQTVLAQERAGNLVQEDTPIVVPSAFAAAFRKTLFPYVHKRLRRNLPDHDMIPTLASEIFVEYLIRLSSESGDGKEVDFAHPKHEAFLRELSDRALAKCLDIPPERFVAVEDAEGDSFRGLKRSGLYDAVLKDIGDKLRGLQEQGDHDGMHAASSSEAVIS